MTRYNTRVNTPHDFILEIPNALDAETCQSIIRRFEADPNKKPGIVGSGVVNPDMKRSTDLRITERTEWEDMDKLLYESLNHGVRKYHELYPHMGEFRLADTGYQVQRTQAGEFYHWHTDVSSQKHMRMYVFIWYLNDVHEGGHTEFKYQGRRVKPEQGKLVLFPATWTHYHRGETVVSGTKYIVTGWMVLH